MALVCERCGKQIYVCDVCLHEFKEGDIILCNHGDKHYCSTACCLRLGRSKVLKREWKN